ncbi:hypothetical protein ASD56_13895 [Microbacterium sp. Root166]|uniref:hypothetical protein n=1 Tax=Microbacterium sp. Root166 TaxID=1736478 RepID=UPI0006FA1559|nr:hypothetical protein [Microbacterium sp. Root166]KQZ83376.1 hypothetical protein ASD56_13895 [Microbacterium sp. Root166]
MKQRTVVGIGVAAVVAIVVAVGAVMLLNRPANPDAAARAFVEALADGDGARASGLLADAPGDVDLAAALEGAAELLSEPVVESVDSADPRHPLATISFRLDDDAHSAAFHLVETDSGWRVDADALGTVTVTTSVGDTVVAGTARIPAGAETPLLPAVYDLEAAPVAVLDGEASATVLPGGSGAVEIPASVSPDATAAAQEQLNAHADDCAAAVDAVPDDCGLRVPWAADLVSLDAIVFRVEQHPALALSPDASSFDATGGVIVATARGTTHAGTSGSFTYRADDWALRGSVSFTGDEMVLLVR